MKYRKLGNNGLKISEISLGTMNYGSTVKKEKAITCLDEAINQGINFIDSADRYGIFDSDLPMEQRIPAELVIGEFLKNHDRNDLVLSSKLWYKMRESENSGGLSRKHIKESIQRTLKNLGTDYLDIYFCHRQDVDTPILETIRTMTNLIDEGLVHYWGTSWHPPWKVQQIIGLSKEHGLIAPNVEQPPYHMGARNIEIDLIPMAKENGLGITSFEALNSGIFTGKYVNDQGQVVIPKDSRAGNEDPEMYRNIIHTRYAEKIVKLRDIANELNITLGNLAIAWTLRHPELSSSITGASRPEHVIENVKASNIILENEKIKEINAILDNDPQVFYR